MGSQPNLASRWEVVSVYKRYPKTFGGPPPNFGCKKNQILDHFYVTFALDTAYLRSETSHRQTNMLMSI